MDKLLAMQEPVGLAITTGYCSSPSLASTSLLRSNSQSLTPRANSKHTFSPQSLPSAYGSRGKSSHRRGASQYGFTLYRSLLGVRKTLHAHAYSLVYLALAFSFLANIVLLRRDRDLHKAVFDDWLTGYSEGYDEAVQRNHVPPVDDVPTYASLWADAPKPRNPTTYQHLPFATTPVNPSEVCVLMSDNRPLDPIPSDLIGHGNLSFPTTTAYLNMHWALRHGYRFIHRGLEGREMPGYHVTWWRLPGMMETVRECEWTVFFDGDAFVNAPEYSLDDMRKRWHIHDKASIFMADEAAGQPEGNINATNFGFLIVRRSDVALKALQDLLECPEKIPECAKRKREFSHEQMAFTQFVRPHLEEGVDFVIGPAEEANCFWNFWGACKGTIVTHAWLAKDDVAERTVGVLAREWLRMLEGYTKGVRGNGAVRVLPS